MKSTMGVKLDEEIAQRLKALGKIKDRSPHWIMKKAIEEYLQREETYERDKQEDMARWRQYKETGEYISHQEMKTKLNAMAQAARNKAKPE